MVFSRDAFGRVDSFLLRKSKSRSRPVQFDISRPPYFGSVSDVYGKKGKLAGFNPPTFGTVENRTAVGLPAVPTTATGVISGTPIGGSSSDVTITLIGRGVTVTKVFKVQIADLVPLSSPSTPMPPVMRFSAYRPPCPSQAVGWGSTASPVQPVARRQRTVHWL